MKRRFNIYNLIFFLFVMIPLLILSVSGCVARSKYLAQVAETESTKSALQDEMKKNAALNDQISKLNSTLAEQKAKIEKLQGEKEKAARKIDELSSAINGLNADLEKTKEATKSDADNFMSEITRLHSERDEARKKIEELSAEVERLTSREKEAQVRIDEISSELKRSQEETKTTAPGEEGLRGEIGRLEKEKEALKKKLDQLSSETDQLNSELATTRSENGNLRGKLESLSSEVTNLTSELNKAREAAVPAPAPVIQASSIQASSDEGLRSEMAKLEKEKTELERKIGDLSSEKQRLVLNLDRAEVESKRFASEMEAAKGDVKNKERELEEMKQTYKSLLEKLKKEVEDGNIKVEMAKEGLSVKILGRVLFASGSNMISRSGKDVLDRVSVVLKNIKDKMIRIEGHTDSKPIGPKIVDKFPTNWELSTARATQVVRYLAKDGIDPKMLSAAGLSMYYPVDTNETKEGREQNRRIEIILYPNKVIRVE